MKRFKLLRVLVLGAALLGDPRALFGCGPFAPEIIFTHTVHPDFPLEAFARGELGVLQPTYARSYLLVAYRHLNGSGVDASAEKALVSLWRERLLGSDETEVDKAVDEWLTERKKITGAGTPPKIDYYRTDTGRNHYFSITNCQADAFKNAAQTLRDRARQLGATNATVTAWAQAQDQVFATCSDGKAIPPPIAAPPLARADRAYQIAAAHFYVGNFAEAARLFDEIAKDQASPWRRLAPLLIARSLIRQATLPEKIELAPLTQAAAQLQRVLDDRELSATHESARRLLAFALYRLDPERRVRALAQAVLEKNAGDKLKQQVIDYTRLLDRYEDEDGKVKVTDAAKQDDVTDWLFTFQADDDAAREHAVQRWRATASPAWLLAALIKLNAAHPQAAALLEAAAKIQPGAPAFATAAYHRVRLALAAGRKDEARQKLDEWLALKMPWPMSARNHFLALRLTLARNADEFFQFAQRAPAAVSYNEDGQELSVAESWLTPEDRDRESTASIKPFLAGRVSFAADGVNIINGALPLAVLKDAALGTTLPPHLRRQVAVAAWTRAVLLDDDETTQALAPALLKLAPEINAQLAGYRAAQNPAQRKDAALYLLLKFPGMRPHVDAGLARLTPHGQIDEYRDNWWCGVAGGTYNEDGLLVPKPAAAELPDFLTAAQRAAVTAERKKLSALEIGPNDLCLRAVAWAKRSPADPRVAEALHLAVKATRFGCRNQQTRQRSKLAFDTLHQLYPNSVWAKQTKYYFGVE